MITEFGAGLLLLVSALCKSFEAIIIEYLEDKGAVAHQLWLLINTGGGVCLAIYWLVAYTYNYRSYSSSGSTTNPAAASLKSYLFQIFPALTASNKRIWLLQAARSICGGSSWFFYALALNYLNSGDFILIQTATITIAGVVLGTVLFGDRFTIYIAISTLLCIIGLLLVCQPTFMPFFDNVSSEPLSWVGVLFALLAGLTRVVTGVVIKQLKYLQVDWLAISLINLFLCTLFGIATLLVVYVINIANGGDASNVWWNWFDIGARAMQVFEYTGLILLAMVMIFCWIISYTLAFQNGQVNSLVLIINSDVIITYLLQIWLLRETDNFVAYIGVLTVLAACVIMFVQEWKRTRNNAKVANGTNISSLELVAESSVGSERNEATPVPVDGSMSEKVLV